MCIRDRFRGIKFLFFCFFMLTTSWKVNDQGQLLKWQLRRDEGLSSFEQDPPLFFDITCIVRLSIHCTQRVCFPSSQFSDFLFKRHCKNNDKIVFLVYLPSINSFATLDNDLNYVKEVRFFRKESFWRLSYSLLTPDTLWNYKLIRNIQLVLSTPFQTM